MKPRMWSRASGLMALGLLGWVLSDVVPANDFVWGAQSAEVPKRRHTLKELRDKFIVKQRTDYSCAAGALATLLTFYFNDPTTELEILKRLRERLSKRELRQRRAKGFTLLDLKRVAEDMGYRAAGFRLKPEQLELLAAPVIVYVEPLVYEHFAVLRGVSGGRVFLADPSRGNLRMSLGRFLQEWNGIVFVLGKHGEESLVDYPLRVPAGGPARPELISISRQIDTAISDVNHYVRRARLRQRRGVRP